MENVLKREASLKLEDLAEELSLDIYDMDVLAGPLHEQPALLVNKNDRLLVSCLLLPWIFLYMMYLGPGQAF